LTGILAFAGFKSMQRLPASLPERSQRGDTRNHGCLKAGVFADFSFGAADCRPRSLNFV